jgi:hypothetical protein
MAHIPFNHFDATAFNNFVPEATNTARSSAFQTVLIIGGLAIGIWAIYRVVNSRIEQEMAKEQL